MSATATTTATEVIARDRRYVADALKIRYYPFVLERGEGPYLFDVEGKRYLDFGAGWAVVHLVTATTKCGGRSRASSARRRTADSCPGSTFPRSIWPRSSSRLCRATSRRRPGLVSPVR